LIDKHRRLHDDQDGSHTAEWRIPLRGGPKDHDFDEVVDTMKKGVEENSPIVYHEGDKVGIIPASSVLYIKIPKGGEDS